MQRRGGGGGEADRYVSECVRCKEIPVQMDAPLWVFTPQSAGAIDKQSEHTVFINAMVAATRRFVM